MTVRIGSEAIVVRSGELKRVPLDLQETLTVQVEPSAKFDIGAGKGKPKTFTVEGGTVGLMLDGRCRPLAIPSSDTQRARKMQEWMGALGLKAG